MMNKFLFLFVSALLLLTDATVNGLIQPISYSRQDGVLSLVKLATKFGTNLCDRVNNNILYSFQNTVRRDRINVMYYSSGAFMNSPLTLAHDNIIRNTDFNINAYTMIYVHGFNARPASVPIQEMAENLSKKNYNFISIDMRHYTFGLDYFYVTRISPHMGFVISEFLVKLCIYGVSPNNIHLVGLSLGAQIAGFVAKAFKDMYNYPLGRITALDPAALCFSIDSNLGLNINDALYVDIIYTSAFGIGIDYIVGHANYYVNNIYGRQPGCSNWDSFCSHYRGLLLFVESVYNEFGFPAKKCFNVKANICDLYDVSYLGLASDPRSYGNYTLRTNNIPPYALGFVGIV